MEEEGHPKLAHLGRFHKKLWYKVNDAMKHAEQDGGVWTLDIIVDYLKGDREYSRQSGKHLTTSVKQILDLIGKDKEGSKENPDIMVEEPLKSPNLMNKSLPFMKKAQEDKENNEKLALLKKRRRIRSRTEDEEITDEIEKKVKFELDPANKITFAHFGGISDTIREIREWISNPLLYSKLYEHLGITSPKGILLCGPPGTGKSMLGTAICHEMNLPFKKLTGTEVVSGMSGESESKLRSIFEEAKKQAPSIIFIDELDSIASKKDNAPKDHEKRITSQLLACFDDISRTNVIVIGATNKPENLDPGFRRCGRFDKEIMMGLPDEKSRAEILEALTKEVKLQDVSFKELAKITAGYVGADLEALIKEAGMLAVKRLIGQKGESVLDAQLNEESQSDCFLIFDDFGAASKRIMPTAKREGFSTVPGTTWSDVGALQELRSELEISICLPIQNPELFAKKKIAAKGGVLLYGPPGCGKTLLAKAVANESKANFIAIKGPELLNKYVGESEKAIREVFSRARISAPCIIFFDEIDAVVPKRGSDGNGVSERVVNTLLTELDGLEELKMVFVVAATNRPDIIDKAMLRPGRLDKMLYVPLPTSSDRVSILKTLARKCPLYPGIDIEKIANDTRCDGFSGADLSSLVKEAAVNSIKRDINDDFISEVDFDKALSSIMPSNSEKERKEYEYLQKHLQDSKKYLSS